MLLVAEAEIEIARSMWDIYNHASNEAGARFTM